MDHKPAFFATLLVASLLFFGQSNVRADQSALVGDINGDGATTIVDYALVRAHIVGTKPLTGDALARADLNKDGGIGLADSYLLRALVSGKLTQNDLAHFQFGDVDQNGQINIADTVLATRIANGLAGTTLAQSVAADVDLNEKVNADDAYLIAQRSVGSLTVLPARMGDLNLGDPKNSFIVTSADWIMIKQAIVGTRSLNQDQKVVANVYRDSAGAINASDEIVLRRFISGILKHIPVVPGDADDNGVVDQNDLTALRGISSGNVSTTEASRLASDVYSDGAVNAQDVTVLEKYLAGQIPAIPVSSLGGSASMQVNSPTSGESFTRGSTITVRWSPALPGVSEIDMVPDVVAPGTSARYVEYGGSIDSYPALTTGTFSFPVTNSYSAGTWRLRVYPSVGNGVAPSNYIEKTISIVGTDPTPLSVVTPNGGESWPLGSTQTVTWSDANSNISSKRYTVFITRENGGAYGIAGEVTGTNQFSWNVGTVMFGDQRITLSPGQYYVQVVKQDGSSMSDQSNGAFTITAGNQAQSSISLTSSVSQGAAPFALDAVLTMRNMNSCAGYSIEYGDGMASAAYPDCPAGDLPTIPERKIPVRYTYRNPGSYTLRVSAGSFMSELPIVVVPPSSPSPTPNASSTKSAVISFRDAATRNFIPNSTISLYMDPGTLIGTQFVPTGYARFNNLANGWYTARGSAAGYNDGAQRFIITDASPSQSTVNIFSSRGTSTPIGRLAVSVQQTPAAHNITAGARQEHFANYQFDTTGSAEDVRLVSANLQLTSNVTGGGSVNDLTNCRLYDGVNVVSDMVNPIGTASPVNYVFTLSPSQVVARNTQKVFALKCDVSPSARNGSYYSWGIALGNNVNAVGVVTGNDIPETITASVGQTMTVQSSGTLSISTDISSPGYTIVPAGRTNVIAGIYRFRATGENISLASLGLRLTSGSAVSTVRVTVWDGTTLVGTGYFTGTNTTTIVPISPQVLVSDGVDKSLTIKVDLSQIGPAQPGVEGDLIKIDYDAVNVANTYGYGQTSGTRINAAGSTAVSGIRMFKTHPFFLSESLPSSGVADGRLMRFQVRAMVDGSVGTDKYSFYINPSGATVSAVNVFAYTDSSYSSPVSDCANGGQMMTSGQNPGAGGLVEIYCQTPAGVRTTLQIPGGTGRYFEVRGIVNSTSTSYSVTTTLPGDMAYPSVPTVGTEAQIDSDLFDNYIWSPNANGTSGLTTSDWTNGYAVSGLPASGLVFTRTN